MASYNHAAYIKDAVQSVLDQSFSDWELLIVDDGSTDETRQVLNQTNDPRIKTTFLEFNRKTHPRNFALSQARGNYVAFLNSDDVYHPAKLERQVEYLDRNPQMGAIFTRVSLIDECNQPVEFPPLSNAFAQPNRSQTQWLRYFFDEGNCLCLPSAMVRRNLFDDAIFEFDPSMMLLADFDLWIRTCLKWDIHVLEETLTSMRILSQNRNLSAASVASSNRNAIERVRTLRHYLSDVAIDQVLKVFPELETALPCDSSVWRQYLLLQRAAQNPKQPIRFFAYQQLQSLLAVPESAKHLSDFHPRLWRNFVLASGAAALSQNAKPMQFTVYVPNPQGLHDKDRQYRFFVDFARQTVVLSIPKPENPGRLRLDSRYAATDVAATGARVYCQQSGRLLLNLTPESELAVDLSGKSELPKRNGAWEIARKASHVMCCLPAFDWDCATTKWLDIEIDLIPLDARDREQPPVKVSE